VTTRQALAALAGWALTRLGGGGPHDEAMNKLRDGCEAALPFVEAEKQPPVSLPSLPKMPEKSWPKPSTMPPPTPKRRAVPVTMADQSCQETGEHRFHISTQCCMYCGQTYRQVKNRDPEFMGK
jgi:ribosomal protein L37E